MKKETSKTEQPCTLHSVINWVAIDNKKPDTWGRYLVCLKNNSVFTLDWNSVSETFTSFALGGVKANNPVKYWAELPKPPCL